MVMTVDAVVFAVRPRDSVIIFTFLCFILLLFVFLMFLFCF